MSAHLSDTSAGTLDQSTGFIRELGLFDATMLVAGSMIGSGIFIVSAGISQDVGSSGWLLLIWILTGVITIMGALSYAELAAMMPQAGGQYVYLREAYGPFWAFLYGWTWFIVAKPASIATITSGIVRVLGGFSALGFLHTKFFVVGLGAGPARDLPSLAYGNPLHRLD